MRGGACSSGSRDETGRLPGPLHYCLSVSIHAFWEAEQVIGLYRPIEGCEFAFTCPLEWERLNKTDGDDKREYHATKLVWD